MQDILDGYAAAATPSFVAAYEALSPDRIYQDVFDLLPKRPARIADVGAGTGRDAAWFADKGHEVLAIEPVSQLREPGRRLHRSDRITWVDDRLPHLTKAQLYGFFDLVVACGVWQHVPDVDRPSAMASLATVTAPGGLLIMSLRHGPGGQGRPVFPVSPDATIEVARDRGLLLIRRREADSIQPGNRAMGVVWTWLAFAKVCS